MKHSCSEELLTLYYYDELPAAQRQDLERHLEICPECRDNLTELRSGLAAVPIAELRLDAAQRGRFVEQVVDKAHRPRRSVVAWGGALASAAALALAILVLQPTTRAPVPPSASELATYEMLEQLDLLQDLELLQQLDLLEELEQAG